MRPFLVAILSGLLLGAAFPPSIFGLIALVAYVPILHIWMQQAHTWSARRILAMAYTMFFVYHGTTNWWVSSWQEDTDPYLKLSGLVLWALHPFFLAVPLVALAWIRKRTNVLSALLSVPFVFTCFEWLHGKSDASYPWLTTGYTTINTPLAQFADTVGVYGLSFLILSINALVVYALMRRSWTPAIAIAGILALWMGYGVVRLRETVGAGEGASLRVGLVQPNENPWDKWRNDKHAQVIRHETLVDSVRRRGERPELVVWSETAIPYTIREAGSAIEFQDLRTWCDTSDVALLTGYPDYVVYKADQAPPSARRTPLDSSLRFDAFNAAMLLQSPFHTIPVHHKTMLTPFAERMPFADQLAFAMSWFEWGVGISSWGKGHTRNPLPVHVRDGRIVNVAPVICIESIYPDVTRDFVNNGADLLCVITNDAWYNGTPGPRQHYDIARMRAIEMRRNLIRCGNSGITGVIDFHGTSVTEVPPMQRAVCMATVSARKGLSTYALAGDVVPWASALWTLATILFGTRIPALLRILRIPSSKMDKKTP